MHFSAYLYLLIIIQLSLCISNNTAIDTNKKIKTDADVLQALHQLLKKGKTVKNAVKRDVWKPEMVLNGTRRIYKGHYAKQMHYPFMASVEIFKEYQCGASIIKSDLLITAASCLQLAWNNRLYRENPTFIKVRVGSQFVRIGGEIFDVLEIYFYPTYDPKTLHNNIAVMRTVKHMVLNQKNGYLRIEVDMNQNSLPTNVEVLILGWGSHLPGNLVHGPVDTHLRDYLLPMYTLPECQNVYGKKYVTQTNFCAGFVSSGTGNACNRDAGGPGVVAGFLVGVISFGSPKCGAPDTPTVFTKVGFYHDWIEEIMEQDDVINRYVQKRSTPMQINTEWLLTAKTENNIDNTEAQPLTEETDSDTGLVVVNITEEQIPEDPLDRISPMNEDINRTTELEYTKPTARMNYKQLTHYVKQKCSRDKNPNCKEKNSTPIRKDQSTTSLPGVVKLITAESQTTSTYLITPICTDDKITRARTKQMLRKTPKPLQQRESNVAFQQITPIKMKNVIAPDISQKKYFIQQTISHSVFSNNNKQKEYFDPLNQAEHKLLFPNVLRESKKKSVQRLTMDTHDDQAEFDQQNNEFLKKESLSKHASVRNNGPRTYVIFTKNNAKDPIASDKPFRTFGNNINITYLAENSSEEYLTTSDSTAESTEKDVIIIDKVKKPHLKLNEKYNKINGKSSKTLVSYDTFTKNSDSHFKLHKTNANFRTFGRSDDNKDTSSEKIHDSNDKHKSSPNPLAKLMREKLMDLIFSTTKTSDFKNKDVIRSNPSAKSNQGKVNNLNSYAKMPRDHKRDVKKNQFRAERVWSTLKTFDKSSSNNVRKPVIMAKTYFQNAESINVGSLRYNQISGRKSRTTNKFMRKEVTHLEPVTYFHKEVMSIEKSSASQENKVKDTNKRAESSDSEVRATESASSSIENGEQNQGIQDQSGQYLNQLDILLRAAFNKLKNSKSFNKKLLTRRSAAGSEEHSKQNIQEVTTTTIKTTTFQIIPMEINNRNNMEESIKNLYTLDAAMELATTQLK